MAMLSIAKAMIELLFQIRAFKVGTAKHTCHLDVIIRVFRLDAIKQQLIPLIHVRSHLDTLIFFSSTPLEEVCNRPLFD